MVDTIKFSQMNAGGDLAPGDSTPGLLGDGNALFTNPAPNLSPGNTANRPAINPIMYNRLRFNTDLNVFEYYSNVTSMWTQIPGSVVGGFLPLIGGTMQGNIDMANFAISNLHLGTNVDANGSTINNLSNPVSSQDAATKFYVDSLVAGLYFLEPADVALTVNLASTYNNGASGVGATLTANVNGAAIIDGIAVSVGNRVLIQNQTSSLENGVYVVTQVGDSLNPAIYTRALDYNAPSDIDPGDFILVKSGTVNGGTGWVESATVNTIGSDPILFLQILSNDYVTTNTTQTITGNKTFTGTIDVPTPVNPSDAANKAYVDGTTSNFVTITTNQTITGNKTFTGTTIVPTPATGTEAANKAYVDSRTTYKAPTSQIFLSGSGTYTTPVSPAPLYIKTTMIGGGGGGAGTGVGGAGNGNAGGITTFGASLLTCAGGDGAVANAHGSGGLSTISVGASGTAFGGGSGGDGTGLVNGTGGIGASSYFGGQGAGGRLGTSGQSATVNTGSGGGGAGGTSSFGSSAGGGSGAVIIARINSPISTYNYNVGASGAGGAAGTSGYAGGTGGSGIIIVDEFYQ